MRNRILLSASLFHALNDAATVVAPMTFPLLYSQKFIITRYAHIGILSNLGLLMTLVFHIIVAQTSDKLEYRVMQAVSCAGICLSLFLLTLSSGFVSLLLLYLLLRSFTSVYHPVGTAWVSRTNPDLRIDLAMGIQSGSGNLGVLLAFLTSGILAQIASWKHPLYFWALLGLVLGTSSFLPVRRITTRPREAVPAKLSRWVETARAMRVYIPGLFLGGACWGIMIYYAPSLFNHKFHIPLGRTGVYMAFWIGLGTVMTFSYGTLSRLAGRRTILLLALFGSVTALFVLGTASAHGLALAGLILFGLSLFLIYPAFQSFVGNEVSARNQSLAFSILANVQVFSGAVVVLVSGFLSDKFGIGSPFLFLGGFAIPVALYYAWELLGRKRRPVSGA